MLLSNVLKDLKERKKLNFKKFNPDIQGIHCNSQKISKNFIFVAIKGEKNDGHKYIDEALKKGAIFIVIESKEVKKSLQKKKLILFLQKIQNYFYQK